MHGGFTPLVVMGGYAALQGSRIPLRDLQGGPASEPGGARRLLPKGSVRPTTRTWKSAVDAAIAGMGEKLDDWERRGMVLPPHGVSNEEFEKAVPGISEEGVACVKGYLHATSMRNTGSFLPSTTRCTSSISSRPITLMSSSTTSTSRKGRCWILTVNHFQRWHRETNISTSHARGEAGK